MNLSLHPEVSLSFRGFSLGPLAIGFSRMSIGWTFHVSWSYGGRWRRFKQGFVSFDYRKEAPWHT